MDYPLKLNQKTIKTRALILCLLLCMPAAANAQWRQAYNSISFYVCAHQDDWQLFMGADVFNDINDYNEKNPDKNGKKAVLIYTTAGNLHDDDDAKSCDCKDPYNQQKEHFPYWKVREHGAMNSVHLAACRMGGWGPNAAPYPLDKKTIINGHAITRYEYKNTVSYFLRLKAVNFEQWATTPYAAVGTVDTSTTYADWADFVNTIYYIYKAEMDSSLQDNSANFKFQDLNKDVNPGDHMDHYISGRAGHEAAKILGKDMNTCFNQALYTDYHTKNLPPNMSTPDMQNETALTAVYSLALLDFNAWPEWSEQYREWNSRNYYREMTTCENAVPDDILAQDGLAQLAVKLFPVPADKNLFLRFNLPVKGLINIRITNIAGATVLNQDTRLNADNTLSVNTGSYPPGTYTAKISIDGTFFSSLTFEVIH